MASTRDARPREALERLHAASVELTRLHEISEITEVALAWAIELTHSSAAFIRVNGDDDSTDRVYARGSEGHRLLAHDVLDRLLKSATGESTLVHRLHAAGRELGLVGVGTDGVYDAAERECFAIFANQLGAALVASLSPSADGNASLRSELDSRTAELGRTVERLRTVDAARQLLLRNVVTAQDKAAKRFAGELHDDALQKLTAAELHLARALAEIDAASPSLAEAHDLLVKTEDALRRLLFEVRPPALDNPGGLEDTIRQRMTMLRALTDADISLELALPDNLAYEQRSMVFRQVSEALTNVEKHSGATRVEVSLHMLDGMIHGVVADNGRGFEIVDRANVPGHIGLMSLKERAILAGGWYKIDSRPGGGTTIEFGLPVE